MIDRARYQLFHLVVLSLALLACGSNETTPDASATPPVDATVVSRFGDPCTCPGPGGSQGSEFECKGTNICSSGLSCIGQSSGGVDRGTCRGPTCCDGAAECAQVLGTRGSCAENQKCVCTFGDLECVGDACTCEGGIPATRGLCYPD